MFGFVSFISCLMMGPNDVFDYSMHQILLKQLRTKNQEIQIQNLSNLL